MLLTLATAVGWAVSGDQPATPAAPPSGGDAGRDIWLRDCAVCHGERGRGSEQGPSLAGVGPAGIDFVVRTGRMPLDGPDDESRRGPVHYSDAQMRALVAHATTFIDGPAVPDVDLGGTDLSRGGELYRLDCASCHQTAGQGGVLIGGTDVPSLGRADAVETIEAMRVGPGDMPRFTAGLLDQDDARDVAAYVQELDAPEDPGGWSLGHWGPVPEGAAALLLGLVPIVVVVRLLGSRNPPGTHEEGPG